MAKKTFQSALEDSKKLQPGWGTYIHFCKVLGESGHSRTEITKLFNKYMPEGEYLKEEKVQLIDYLVQISKEVFE